MMMVLFFITGVWPVFPGSYLCVTSLTITRIWLILRALSVQDHSTIYLYDYLNDDVVIS